MDTAIILSMSIYIDFSLDSRTWPGNWEELRLTWPCGSMDFSFVSALFLKKNKNMVAKVVAMELSRCRTSRRRTNPRDDWPLDCLIIVTETKRNLNRDVDFGLGVMPTSMNILLITNLK